MIISGIDYSKNSPGVVQFVLNDDFSIYNISYLGFTDIKKIANKDTNIIHYHKKQFSDDIEKAIFIRDRIIGFFQNNHVTDYVAFEGYALNAKGMVFDIAESTMCTKLKIYENNIPIRIYDPNSIKKYSTGYGNSDKIRMEDDYEKLPLNKRINLSHLPEYKSPKIDIIDAFWICKLLHTELLLRNGIIQLKDLDIKKIEVFNRVTKTYPENILVRPFIHKNMKEI